jgi:hypothetical protein
VVQNPQIGAFLGGSNLASSRLLFGDSGSTNCSDAAFQRHSYESITSTLVRGAVVVARPATAKINGCNICKNSSQRQAAAGNNLKNAPCSPPGTCANSDFPLWLFASSDLYATKIDVVASEVAEAKAKSSASTTTTTRWSCFNGANETFACAALGGAGGGGASKFTPSLCIADTTALSSRSGILQMGTLASRLTEANQVAILASCRWAPSRLTQISAHFCRQ